MKKYMGFVLATVSTMVGVVSWLLPDIDFRYKLIFTIFLIIICSIFILWNSSNFERQLNLKNTDSDIETYYKRVFKLFEEHENDLKKVIEDNKLNIKGKIQLNGNQAWVQSGNYHKIAIKGGHIYVFAGDSLKQAEQNMQKFYEKYKENLK